MELLHIVEVESGDGIATVYGTLEHLASVHKAEVFVINHNFVLFKDEIVSGVDVQTANGLWRKAKFFAFCPTKLRLSYGVSKFETYYFAGKLDKMLNLLWLRTDYEDADDNFAFHFNQKMKKAKQRMSLMTMDRAESWRWV